jgi:hypothetical protein
MDDQNKTQPLVPVTSPTLPNALEDITPVDTLESAPLSVTPPVADTEPAIPQSTQETSPSEAAPVAAWPVPEPAVVTPTAPSAPTETYVTPVPTPTDPEMPESKPKSKLMPIIGGLAALLMVFGVAGAAYYVSNQLSSKVAVAPNAPTSKPYAMCAEDQQGDGKGGCMAIPGASTQNNTPNTSSKPANCLTNCPQGTIGSGKDEWGCYICSAPNSSACVSPKTSCGNLCCNDGDFCCCTGCFPEGTNCDLHQCDSGGGGSTTTTTNTSCINYTLITNPTSAQENQIICSPDKSHINTVSFATAGLIRIHIEGAPAGSTVKLTKGSANATVTKVDDKNFDSSVEAGIYTIAIKLGTESTNALGYIKPTSDGKCGRYGGSKDVSSRITTSALSGFGIGSITGIDSAIQCWADSIQGSDTNQYGQLIANYDFEDFDVQIGYKPTTVVGACSAINIYKKVGSAYSTTALTATELQNLKVGDVLKLTTTANLDGVGGRFRVTVAGTAGNWLTGTADSTNKKLIIYSDYSVATAGTYKFEGQVTTTAQ